MSSLTEQKNYFIPYMCLCMCVVFVIVVRSRSTVTIENARWYSVTPWRKASTGGEGQTQFKRKKRMTRWTGEEKTLLVRHMYVRVCCRYTSCATSAHKRGSKNIAPVRGQSENKLRVSSRYSGCLVLYIPTFIYRSDTKPTFRARDLSVASYRQPSAATAVVACDVRVGEVGESLQLNLFVSDANETRTRRTSKVTTAI